MLLTELQDIINELAAKLPPDTLVRPVDNAGTVWQILYAETTTEGVALVISPITSDADWQPRTP